MVKNIAQIAGLTFSVAFGALVAGSAMVYGAVGLAGLFNG